MKTILLVRNLELDCILLRQVDNYVVVCCQDRIIKCKVIEISFDDFMKVEIAGPTLLDLAFVI